MDSSCVGTSKSTSQHKWCHVNRSAHVKTTNDYTRQMRRMTFKAVYIHIFAIEVYIYNRHKNMHSGGAFQRNAKPR